MLATEAFLTHNAQVTAGTQAESILEREAYLDTFGDIEDVVTTLKRVAKLHEEIAAAYHDYRNGRILSNSDTFFIGLMAGCGYIRAKINMKSLDGALDKLEEQLVLSRGKRMRRLVNDTFLRFFTGSTTRLEWLDTAQQI